MKVCYRLRVLIFFLLKAAFSAFVSSKRCTISVLTKGENADYTDCCSLTYYPMTSSSIF